jgi:site-specific DNA-adenine methylase
MTKTYGIPYTGSKSGIAEEILSVLPNGKRFVDLFGGGFAMSHCCLLNFCGGLFPKFEQVLYNDHNPLLKPLIEKAIKGDFNYSKFKPEWISRKKFFAEKEKDGYIKWIWSFSNDGNTYLFSREIEEQKRQLHNLVVFGEENFFTKGINLVGDTVKERRLSWYKFCRGNKQRSDLPELAQLERLQELEQLERLQSLEQLQRQRKLELTCMDYQDYVYQDGDIVYCDIPYELSSNKTCYGGGFNHKKFRQWANSQPFPIFVSSYIDTRIIWQKTKRCLKAGSKNIFRQECLYQYGGF